MHWRAQEDFPDLSCWIYFENLFLGIELGANTAVQHVQRRCRNRLGESGIFMFEIIIRISHFGMRFFYNDQCPGCTGQILHCGLHLLKLHNMHLSRKK